LTTAFAFLALASSLVRPEMASQLSVHSQPARTSPVDDPVDINKASVEKLIKVPGLTRTWAARIIRFRPYRAKNELLDRGVVSVEVYARIKDHIIAHRIRD